MKQVLLADQSHLVSKRLRPAAPFVMWMSDDVLLGDVFQWRNHVYQVKAVYGTRYSTGVECKRTEFPKSHRASGVVLDQRGGESTGVPGANSQRSH